MYEYIAANLDDIRARIDRAARRIGQAPEAIRIVAVTKTFPPDMIKAAIAAGITEIGESRVQEAEPKIAAVGKAAKWHMIGHLQTNKARKAIELFDMIQSVDSIRIAEELNNAGVAANKKIGCLLELNSTAEASKYGISPTIAAEMLDTIVELPHIRLCGLMTVGPQSDDEIPIRNAFRLTREIFDRGKSMVGESFSILSMGMSGDFEIAVEEGANMIRLGTALFGRRK